ncbi:MAG: helix-turn-helix transcriptional regulator [Solirubrobacteraceae bacterium]
MKKPRTYSPQVVEAARLLGAQVRVARLERRWTVEELAERAGVSHNTMRKVERGDLTIGLGPAFEAAALVGVPLFHANPERRSLEARETEARLAVVPARARRPRRNVDVDF